MHRKASFMKSCTEARMKVSLVGWFWDFGGRCSHKVWHPFLILVCVFKCGFCTQASHRACCFYFSKAGETAANISGSQLAPWILCVSQADTTLGKLICYSHIMVGYLITVRFNLTPQSRRVARPLGASYLQKTEGIEGRVRWRVRSLCSVRATNRIKGSLCHLKIIRIEEVSSFTLQDLQAVSFKAVPHYSRWFQPQTSREIFFIVENTDRQTPRLWNGLLQVIEHLAGFQCSRWEIWGCNPWMDLGIALSRLSSLFEDFQ